MSLKIHDIKENLDAINFCNEFINSNKPKYIFGRNEFAESIAKVVEVDGFIDDFTKEKVYLGKPIVRTEDVSENAFVVVTVIGKPLLAEKRVKQFKLHYLDYFAFYKYSKIKIKQVMFWNGFVDDFEKYRSKYEKFFDLLEDDISKRQFYKIVNFRLSYEIGFMRGFKAIEDKQYFEEFLNLSKDGESFVDVGGYDGYTTEEFIKRCPNYKLVHFFEPEEKFITFAKKRLEKFENINYHALGLSDKKQTVRFDVSQSSSKISDSGSIVIQVDRLDDIINEPVTFIKMDIEGAEESAIDGGKETIKKYHPKLAISVYHKANDFWKIPEQIFAIRDDYKIYLRHYTEGISETVMFFIPIKD